MRLAARRVSGGGIGREPVPASQWETRTGIDYQEGVDPVEPESSKAPPEPCIE